MNLFDHGAVIRVRIARPTDRLEEIERFYHQVIGLPKIRLWRDGVDSDHAGYDGRFSVCPKGVTLEFTHRRDASSSPAPGRDNLLVFYLPHSADIARMRKRMRDY